MTLNQSTINTYIFDVHVNATTTGWTFSYFDGNPSSINLVSYKVCFPTDP